MMTHEVEQAKQELNAHITKAANYEKLKGNRLFKEFLVDLEKEAINAGVLTIQANEEMRKSGMVTVQSVAWVRQHMNTIKQYGDVAEQQLEDFELQLAEEAAELNAEYEG